jgi:hypothetical protein
VNLPHLAQRLFNTPLAIHPSKAEVIMAAVMDRFGISRIESSFAMEDDDYCYDDDQGRNTRRDPGYDNVAGVAVIPIRGTLVQKLGSLRPWSGMTGYDGIRQAFLTAMADPEVKGCVWISIRQGKLPDVSTWSTSFTTHVAKSPFTRFCQRVPIRRHMPSPARLTKFMSPHRRCRVDWRYYHAYRLDTAH